MGILDLFRGRPENRDHQKKLDLLALQNLLVHNAPPDKLICDEGQLMSLANMKAQSNLRKVDESLAIIKNTHDKDTFYSRIDFLESVLERLVQLEPFVKFSGTTPSLVRAAWYRDKDQLISDFQSRPGALYYEHMDQIETQWSVLTNLKMYTGDQADAFEEFCKRNVREFYEMVGYNKGKNQDYVSPSRAPAFVRLAMLYERRGDYKNAISICADAIRAGCYDDGSNGKMYGRLARLIRKSGIDVSDEVKRLALLQA